ncbi:MAG: RluA family pseudouridine synthase [Planctomycetes bacterium]|nr:RluA family pseudouridine synthase [Planctomycetota bacterium]
MVVPAEQIPVDEALAGARLVDFLERICPGCRRADLRWLVAAGRVTVNGMPIGAQQRLRPGDLVGLDRGDLAGRTQTTAAPLPPVLFASPTVLVVDKPPGLPTVPDRSGRQPAVHDVLAQLRPGGDLRIVHRLDRDTSGCLLLGDGLAAARHFDQQFRGGAVRKTYVALVDGVPAADQFAIDAWLGPDPRRPGKVVSSAAPGRGRREAHTLVTVRRRFARHALVGLQPTTGRGHQLRVHLASVGHAIVHDADYGGQPLLLSSLKSDYKLRRGVAERPLLRRMFLHAERIEFEDVDGARIDVRAPLPADLELAVQKLDVHGGRRR